eukprot:gnl/TRDRNA2_/TRDRNA2_81382_c0_seq1.p1 gnl/TRDRNA2_/TRDRNA2_81382_c0~~gnl/TRDRNA2_/TRDRNA2_81382_c0_seq1.p1  ORF type:complete len:185 (+),score=32.10 gnl/TRDRNA2_/TRDRNA2_81382_c0_seq1:59-613(+)
MGPAVGLKAKAKKSTGKVGSAAKVTKDMKASKVAKSGKPAASEKPASRGYAVVGLLAHCQGSASAASYASILGDFVSKEEANERVREELDRLKSYVRDAFGNGLADKISKQATRKESGGLSVITASLQGVVSRNDSFRWQTIEATVDREKIAQAFFKQSGASKSRVKWMEANSFMDGMDLWLLV